MTISPVDGFVASNGIRLHYRRWSPQDSVSPSLPSILLLHGLASSAHIWNLVAPLLAAQGYMVTALDQRGHGESEKPDHGYDFATIVADDYAAVQSLHIERPVIVGHSWGAAVALQYAATYVDEISALALVDGATNQMSSTSGWSREQAMKDLAPPRFAGTPRETFLSYIRRGPLEQQWTPELEDIMLHIVQLRDDDTVAPRLVYENHLQIIGAMWDQPTFDLYRQVKCPVTLIVAEMETADPSRERFRRMRREGIERIQNIRPDVRVVRMADTIHDIPLQRPAQLVEEILRAATNKKIADLES
jgi:pimeloyl-ACP methyl ester carboxylesterase